jgi:hypothetical protein
MTTRSDTTELPVAPAVNQTPDRGHCTHWAVPATDTDHYTQASRLQPDTLSRCSGSYVFPEATFWNLACYQAHSYERCHSDVDRTLWLIDDLPEEEPCHRNTQENASFKYYQHEMSVYK